MRKALCLSLLAALAALASCRSVQLPCCVPDAFNGRLLLNKNSDNDTVTRRDDIFFIMDFLNQRVYAHHEGRHQSGGMFNFEFIANFGEEGVIYVIDRIKESCERVPTPATMSGQCIPAAAILRGAMNMGDGDALVPALKFSFLRNMLSQHQATMTVTQGDCMPIMDESTRMVDASEVIEKMLFYDMVKDSGDPRLFMLPSFCHGAPSNPRFPHWSDAFSSLGKMFFPNAFVNPCCSFESYRANLVSTTSRGNFYTEPMMGDLALSFAPNNSMGIMNLYGKSSNFTAIRNVGGDSYIYLVSDAQEGQTTPTCQVYSIPTIPLEAQCVPENAAIIDKMILEPGDHVMPTNLYMIERETPFFKYNAYFGHTSNSQTCNPVLGSMESHKFGPRDVKTSILVSDLQSITPDSIVMTIPAACLSITPINLPQKSIGQSGLQGLAELAWMMQRLDERNRRGDSRRRGSDRRDDSIFDMMKDKVGDLEKEFEKQSDMEKYMEMQKKNEQNKNDDLFLRRYRESQDDNRRDAYLYERRNDDPSHDKYMYEKFKDEGRRQDPRDDYRYLMFEDMRDNGPNYKRDLFLDDKRNAQPDDKRTLYLYDKDNADDSHDKYLYDKYREDKSRDPRDDYEYKKMYDMGDLREMYMRDKRDDGSDYKRDMAYYDRRNDGRRDDSRRNDGRRGDDRRDNGRRDDDRSVDDKNMYLYEKRNEGRDDGKLYVIDKREADKEDVRNLIMDLIRKDDRHKRDSDAEIKDFVYRLMHDRRQRRSSDDEMLKKRILDSIRKSDEEDYADLEKKLDEIMKEEDSKNGGDFEKLSKKDKDEVIKNIVQMIFGDDSKPEEHATNNFYIIAKEFGIANVNLDGNNQEVVDFLKRLMQTKLGVNDKEKEKSGNDLLDMLEKLKDMKRKDESGNDYKKLIEELRSQQNIHDLAKEIAKAKDEEDRRQQDDDLIKKLKYMMDKEDDSKKKEDYAYKKYKDDEERHDKYLYEKAKNEEDQHDKYLYKRYKDNADDGHDKYLYEKRKEGADDSHDMYMYEKLRGIADGHEKYLYEKYRDNADDGHDKYAYKRYKDNSDDGHDKYMYEKHKDSEDDGHDKYLYKRYRDNADESHDKYLYEKYRDNADSSRDKYLYEKRKDDQEMSRLRDLLELRMPGRI